MATATILYDNARKYLLDGTVICPTDTLKFALLANTYVPRPGTPAWTAFTAYVYGNVVTYEGRYYECIVAGTSSGAPPLFDTTTGDLTTDNTVTWYCWGYAPPSEHEIFADVSAHEIAASGYSAGGVTLTGVTVTKSVHSAIVTANPASWSNVTISARYAVIYKVGTANGWVNPLLAYLLLDTNNVDVGSTVSATFTVAWAAATGVFVFN